MKDLLIYGRVTPIRVDDHKDVSVQAGATYGFARHLNSAPVLAAEIPVAARHFAVVFAGTAERVLPAVVLGVRSEDNAFVDTAGRWTGGYVPAFLRRYPFVFAEGADDTLTLCIDEDFEGLRRDGRGERLFDAEGVRTRYLDGMVQFAADFQRQFEVTRAFCARLVSLGLLEPAHARFTLPGGAAAAITGFFAISREKLKAIPPDTLQAMFSSDELELCFIHLASLENVSGVVAAMAARDREAAQADAGAAVPPSAGAAEPLTKH